MNRTETGVFAPENRAYPGVFIAGDDALYRFLPALRCLAADTTPPAWAQGAVRELCDILQQCEVRT